MINETLELSNVQDLDTSVLNAIGAMTPNFEYSSSAEGDEGDEDSVEDEGEVEEVGGLEESEKPKFRQLVRQKKIDFKAKYGKKRWKVTQAFKNYQVGDTVSLATALAHPRKTVLSSGWRKQWRDFKKSGGLAQIKQYVKGLRPDMPVTSADFPPSQAGKLPIGNLGSAVKGQVKTKQGVVSQDMSQQGDNMRMADTEGDDKILGMNKNLAIGLGVAVLAVAGFFIYKKVTKK